jgi:hypothetical protein
MLKQKLISQPIPQYTDFSKEFILATHASNEGAGAVLSYGEIGKDHPITYVSRSFNEEEKVYGVVEKELATIEIVSDHKPLTWIVNVKVPGSIVYEGRLKSSWTGGSVSLCITETHCRQSTNFSIGSRRKFVKEQILLTFQDELSKFVVAIPIEHQDTETSGRVRVDCSAKIRRTRANSDRLKVEFREQSL